VLVYFLSIDNIVKLATSFLNNIFCGSGAPVDKDRFDDRYITIRSVLWIRIGCACVHTMCMCVHGVCVFVCVCVCVYIQ